MKHLEEFSIQDESVNSSENLFVAVLSVVVVLLLVAVAVLLEVLLVVAKRLFKNELCCTWGTVFSMPLSYFSRQVTVLMLTFDMIRL
jgi:hypothetical protein